MSPSSQILVRSNRFNLFTGSVSTLCRSPYLETNLDQIRQLTTDKDLGSEFYRQRLQGTEVDQSWKERRWRKESCTSRSDKLRVA